MQFAGITFLDREEDVQRNPVYWAGELSLQLGGEEGSRVLSKKTSMYLGEHMDQIISNDSKVII